MPKRGKGPANEDERTWRYYTPDYTHDTPLLTRGELVFLLEGLQSPLSERTLRYWEAQGVLPYPVRQMHEGKVQAVYPNWILPVIAIVLQRREAGESLAAIAADMPIIVRDQSILVWSRQKRNFLLRDVQPSLLPGLRELAARASTPERPVTQGLIHLFDAERKQIVALWWDPSDGLPAAELSDAAGNDPPSDSEGGVAPGELSDGGGLDTPSDT